MSKEKNSKTPSAAIPVTNNIDFFEKLGNKGIFLALLIIAIVTFLVFKDYIILKKIYLFKDIGSDTLNGVWPSYYHMDYYFNNNGLPTWSFNEGMGQNIVGTVMRDPFAVLAFLAGPEAMPQIFIFIEVTKILAGGIVFYAFLKQLKISNFSALVGCLLFAFSGFMIMGSCWYVFTFEAFTLAFLFLAFELYFQKNNWFIFIIAIFLIAVTMPFNLYVSTIILLCYMIFRLGQTGTFSFKNLFVLSLKLVGLALIGVLLAGPFFLETVLQLVESPRGSGGNSYFKILSSKPMFGLIDRFQFGTFITRLFSSDYIGSGSDFRGFQNFLEAPLSYCGVLSIILMPQIFTLVSKSTRKWYIIWLVIWLVPTIFPFFRYAFWLFTGDYYRVFSFCVSFVLIIYSVLALDLILKVKKINVITLIATIVASVALLSVDYFKGTAASVDSTIALFVKIAMIAYAIMLFFIAKPDANPNLRYLLLGFLCLELAYLSSFTVNRRPAVTTAELSQKINYNDYSVEAVDYIKKNETGFYRIDKNYYSSGAIHGSLNDHKILNYYSTSSYNSFANTNFINYFREYGVISKENEYESRWVSGLIARPVLESLNNVKYILSKGPKNPLWQSTHDSVAGFGDVAVLKSKYALPFGYTYDKYLKQSDFDRLSTNQKDFVSLQACVVSPEDEAKIAGIKSFNLADTNTAFTFETYKMHIDSLKRNALKLTEFSQTKLAGEIRTEKPEIMYLSFAFDKGWHLKLDGADAKLMIVDYGMTGIYLPKGDHKIEMHYTPRVFSKGYLMLIPGLLLIVVLYFLDKKNYRFFKYRAEAEA